MRGDLGGVNQGRCPDPDSLKGNGPPMENENPIKCRGPIRSPTKREQQKGVNAESRSKQRDAVSIRRK